MKEINGRHVFGMMVLGFGTIIAVNISLAVNAVRTFPGLEVRNSYVASQTFDQNRVAQEALNWTVRAQLDGNTLRLSIRDGETPVEPDLETAIFGRATSVNADQNPEFVFDGTDFVAPVQAGVGNWNLRLKARAADGTLFQQRVIVEAAS